MSIENNSDASSKLLECLDLMEVSIEMVRQLIIRRFPNASKDHVESELHRWLFEQPEIFVPRDPENRTDS